MTLFINGYLTIIQQTIEFPSDLLVWGGLSLSVVFNILVSFLTALGIFKPETKKRIGGYLMILGALTGGVFAFSTKVVDNMQILTYIVAGGLSGLLAVGNYSFVKNFRESLKMKQ
jgi:hypothetical protein